MERKLCKCGCGEYANTGRKFIKNHSSRLQKKKPKPTSTLCECGCGEYAKPGNRFIYGHNFKVIKKTKEHKAKISAALRGRTFSDEHLANIKIAQNSPETKEKIKTTWLKKYGVENLSQSEKIKAKKKLTSQKRYGVDYPMQSKRVQAIHKKTCLKNLGVENPSQNAKVQEKKKLTSQKNYRVDYPTQSKKVQKRQEITCLSNHGVTRPMQSKRVQAIHKKTCLKNLGVENPSQNAKVIQTIKNKKGRLYKYPSSTTIIIEGNEDLALNQLLDEGYTEDDIFVTYEDMPEFWYETSDGKIHRYFPDIFIPKENLIIEVKARENYWKRNSRNIFIRKKLSVLDAGYNFRQF